MKKSEQLAKLVVLEPGQLGNWAKCKPMEQGSEPKLEQSFLSDLDGCRMEDGQFHLR